jgi:hypothetical protein
MSLETIRFTDGLRRSFDLLRVVGDNEAQRRDLLIRPVLIDPLGLGYFPDEVLTEIPFVWPPQFKKDHLFRADKAPKRILPDYVLWPRAWQQVAGVVEAKGRSSLTELTGHRFQLAEQQVAFSTNWGILTNGIQWVIFHAFEPVVTVESLEELGHRLPDIQRLVGREAILERMRRSGRASLIHLVITQPDLWSFTTSFDEELERTAARIRERWLRERESPPTPSRAEDSPSASGNPGPLVEVVHGPLKGVVGRFVRQSGPGRSVISVDLIGRGVAVTIDDKDVKPFMRGGPPNKHLQPTARVKRRRRG